MLPFRCVLFSSVCCLMVAYHVSAGPAYEPVKLDGVPVWTNANAAWFQQPELSTSSNYSIPTISKRPNFGIALSGGGYRAATLALGYMRALQMMNATHKARYTSSNSGGSWFNAAFTYQAVMPVEKFLGPYVPPAQLTLQSLAGVKEGLQGSFAATITQSSIVLYGVTAAVADASTSIDKGPGAWSLSVGRAFLRPYKLDADKSTITVNGTKGIINATLQQLPGIDVYAYQADYDRQSVNNIPRPFPLILGTIYDSLANSTSVFYPVEFTPLYIGCPAVYLDPENNNQTVGGGYVGVQGFNSAPPNPAPVVPPELVATLGKMPAVITTAAAVEPATTASEGGVQTNSSTDAATRRRIRDLLQDTAANARGNTSNTTTTAAPGAAAAAAAELNAMLPLRTAVKSTYVLPLKSMVGISSSFLAQGVRPEGVALQELTGTETLDYWNQVNFTGGRRQFADGGGTDNLAITPLLRRHISSIVSCIAAVMPITEVTTAEDWASVQWDVAALFGAVPVEHPAFKKGQVPGIGVTPAQLNKASQVFLPAGYADLFKALKASVAAGGPAYHLASYEVQANAYQAINPGWQVTVLWVVNAVQTRWESQLPAEVQGMLAKSRTMRGGLYEGNTTVAQNGSGDAVRELKMFPYVSTLDANYGPQLTGLLSQMATWQMLQLQPRLEQLIRTSASGANTTTNAMVSAVNASAGA